MKSKSVEATIIFLIIKVTLAKSEMFINILSRVAVIGILGPAFQSCQHHQFIFNYLTIIALQGFPTCYWNKTRKQRRSFLKINDTIFIAFLSYYNRTVTMNYLLLILTPYIPAFPESRDLPLNFL